jgi:sporulation protein YlmC with PRC-barrel domain
MNRKICVVLSIMAILVLAVGSYAADMGGMKSSGMMSSSSTTGNQIFKASDLIGADVKNMQGQDLGKINDLAVNSRGNVTFAVISHGGALGLGSKLVPVPMSALQIEQNGKIARVDISKDKFDSAPSFTSANWPDMSNQKWMQDTYRYYGVSPAFEGRTGGTMPSEKMAPGSSQAPADSSHY